MVSPCKCWCEGLFLPSWFFHLSLLGGSHLCPRNKCLSTSVCRGVTGKPVSCTPGEPRALDVSKKPLCGSKTCTVRVRHISQELRFLVGKVRVWLAFHFFPGTVLLGVSYKNESAKSIIQPSKGREPRYTLRHD